MWVQALTLHNVYGEAGSSPHSVTVGGQPCAPCVSHSDASQSDRWDRSPNSSPLTLNVKHRKTYSTQVSSVFSVCPNLLVQQTRGKSHSSFFTSFRWFFDPFLILFLVLSLHITLLLLLSSNLLFAGSGVLPKHLLSVQFAQLSRLFSVHTKKSTKCFSCFCTSFICLNVNVEAEQRKGHTGTVAACSAEHH